MRKIGGFSKWKIEICEALGEDPNEVMNMNINIPVDGAVVATIEKFLFEETTGERSLATIKKCAWIEEPEEKQQD